MENGSKLLNSTPNVHWLEPPSPKLLMELEPARRVFCGNLIDVLLRRQVPQVRLISRPAPFWRDVFVYTGAPWGSFAESALWHTTAVLILLTISRGWGAQIEAEKPLLQSSHVIYYTPDPSFPARGSSPPRSERKPSKAEPMHPIQVAREARPQPRRLVAPPDIAALTKPAPLPKPVGSASVAPAMPLAAIPGPQGRELHIGASVIQPPSEVKQAAGWRSNGLQVVVVAPAPLVKGGVGHTTSLGAGGLQPAVIEPAPQVGAIARRRGIEGPKAGAVAPAPAIQRGSLGRASYGGGGDLMHVVVVGPAPELSSTRGTAGSEGTGFGGTGAGVVPPPPAVPGSGNRRGTGDGGSSLGSGFAAIPPPPSVDGRGRLTGRGGDPAGGPGVGVVPPPPAVGGMGRAGAGGGGGLGGSEWAAVPPAPSLGGAGGRPGFGAGSLSGGSLAAGPADPSNQGAGGESGDGASSGGSDPVAVAPQPSVDGLNESNLDHGLSNVVEELPMRIVGLAFALRSTSFSSSYEVFIAEKDLKGHKELIKLVYWFLPYQTRLSEYHPDASRMYKLRVTRDRVCDESLEHMTVSSTGQAYAGSRLSSDALSTADPNMMLPCYRTTADDYQKATGRRR